MPRARMTGLRMFLPLLAVLALAAVWSGWWYAVFTTAKARYAEQEERLAARGVTLGCAAQWWGGYPFRVEMICEEPKLAIEREGKTTVISASRLAAVLQAYNPTHGLVLLTGPTSVQPPQGARPETITHGRARASIRLGEAGRPQVSVEAPDVALAGLAQADRLLLHLREGDGAPFDVAGTVTGLQLNLEGVPLALDRADFEALVPADIADGPDPLAAAARAGTPVEIKRLDLRQEPLTVSATGTLSLDSEGRLNGKLSTTVSDLDLLLERVTTQVALPPDDVSAAKTLLGVLKAAGSRIDIVAKSGKLYWGPIKIAEVPPLVE